MAMTLLDYMEDMDRERIKELTKAIFQKMLDDNPPSLLEFMPTEMPESLRNSIFALQPKTRRDEQGRTFEGYEVTGVITNFKEQYPNGTITLSPEMLLRPDGSYGYYISEYDIELGEVEAKEFDIELED